MNDKQTFVIAGAGLAGAKAAETLREQGFDGRLVLVGDEPHRPYERPPLSKEYLRGETDDPPYVHGEDFYAEHEIELITETAATEIDAAGRELVLSDGNRVRFDRLLIATGARPRRLDLPGADLDGIHYLRTLDDSEALRARIDAGGRVIVIGSGWIGAEIAASARQRGCEVTMLEVEALPLERVLGPQLGRFYLDQHRAHGVEFLPETTVERFEGDGSVRRVVTRDGAQLEADFVVVGIGVEPRTELAATAGIAIDNGILVDERLETNVPGVFAAGDVANAHHPFFGRRLRVEHWANALTQGPAAARSMLGEQVSYDEIPYFFSDQYEIGMEYGGFTDRPGEDVVIRGDLEAAELIAFWLEDDRVVAGMNVNIWDVNETIRELIRSRQPVDRDRLRDPGVELATLVAEAAGRS